ncbi:MAG: hypothetical protein Q9161_009488 [Pseudevernia consocians]
MPEASIMPRPFWMPDEEIVAVWFLSRGIEIPDVARIMEHRLQSPTRDKRKITLYMDKIFNPSLALQGYPQVCTPGMLDWDKDAVDDFIIRMTNDRYRLQDILRFSNHDKILLEEYHNLNIPLEQVLSLTVTGVIHLDVEGVASFEEPLCEACRYRPYEKLLACGYLREYRHQFVERHTSVDNSAFSLSSVMDGINEAREDSLSILSKKNSYGCTFPERGGV